MVTLARERAPPAAGSHGHHLQERRGQPALRGDVVALGRGSRCRGARASHRARHPRQPVLSAHRIVHRRQVRFFDPAVGGDRTYQTYEVAYQGYRKIGSNNVIAYRGAVCAADGDVPFYNLCLLGQSKGIRGYEVGRYQDRRMIDELAQLAWLKPAALRSADFNELLSAPSY